MPIKDEYQIVVVGGGLVGATLALALKQIRIDVLVLEAFATDSEKQPSFDDRSVALSLASLKVFKKLGLSEGIQKHSQAIENIHVSDQGHYGFARLESKKLNVNQLGAVIENRLLGSLLLNKIEQEKIEYCSPAKVINANKSELGYKLSIEIDGGSKIVQTKLLILADGTGSILKKELGFQTKVTDFKRQAIVCNLVPQQPHQNWAYERFTKNGPLALLPLTKNRLSIVWSNSLERCEELINCSEQEFTTELMNEFGARLGRFTKIGKRVKFPLTQSVSQKTFKENCLLMGNSAQALHPIAGQGLNLALRDILSLQRHLKALDDDDFGSYMVLQEFEKLRERDRKETIASTEGLAKLFANEWLPLSLSRNLLMKFMDVTPALKEAFAMKAMGFKS